MEENVCTFGHADYKIEITVATGNNRYLEIPLMENIINKIFGKANDYAFVANEGDTFKCAGNVLYGCTNVEDLSLSQGSNQETMCGSNLFNPLDFA